MAGCSERRWATWQLARHSEALAFLTGSHRRIVADSPVQSFPSPAVDCVLEFLLLPEPFEWAIFLFRCLQLTHGFMLFDCMRDVWSISAPMPSVCYHPAVVTMRGPLYTLCNRKSLIDGAFFTLHSRRPTPGEPWPRYHPSACCTKLDNAAAASTPLVVP